MNDIKGRKAGRDKIKCERYAKYDYEKNKRRKIVKDLKRSREYKALSQNDKQKWLNNKINKMRDNK